MFAFKHGLFAALMLFVLVLSACAQSDRETTQNENSAESAGETAVTGSEGVPTTADVIIDTELTTVKVVSLPFISFAPIYIAMDEGYFEEQGLAIEIVSFTQQQDTLPALVSGDVDVIGGLVSSAYLNAIARGGEIKIVADKGYIDPDGCSNFAIVANSSLLESDGQVNPDALRGQIISAQQGTWQTYYVDKELNTIGLSLADVELASIPSPAQPDALTQGSIAASAQNEPWVTILSAQGHQTILEPVQELLPESQSAVLLYGPSLLNDNPEAGDRFMAAYLKAVAQYNEGKTERNIEILAKHLELETELLQNMCWPTLRADGSIDVPSILDFQEWAIANEFLDTPVTEDQFWDGRFIENGAALLEESN